MLIALAIAPGIAICIFIFLRDAYDREPGTNLVMSFLWGALSIVPALLIELAIIPALPKTLFSIFLRAFILVALTEELSKFAVLRLYAYTRKSFDEPFDGIVYSVMAAMGFATMENIGYVWLTAHNDGWYIGLMRTFSSVPAHASFSIIMGYFVGRARFDFENRGRLLFQGLLWALVAHGMYDAFLFLAQNSFLQKKTGEWMLFCGAMLSLFLCIQLSRRLIKLHYTTSRKLFMDSPELDIRTASLQDIDLIRSLAFNIWPQTYQDILTADQMEYMLSMMYSKQALQLQMNEGHTFLIASNAGVPIGFASYSNTEPGVFKLHKIYILPRQQGKGIGKELVGFVEKQVAALGAHSLVLNVNRNNKAKLFYERIGFSVKAIEDIDIGDGYLMNDYVMEKKVSA